MGLCIALALILSYVEILLPPLFPSVPGIKMGLANIIIVFLLYRCGMGAACVTSILRIVLVSMLFGNFMAFLYSLAGAVLSLLLMALLRRFNFVSEVGVSVSGAVAHNIGQILMAIVLLGTTQIAYYLVVLIAVGTIAGILIGLCAAALIKRIPEKFLPLK